MRWLLLKALFIGCIVYSYTFSRISILMSPIKSQKTLNMNLFLTTAPRTFSLPDSQCISTQSTVFSIQTLCGKPIFSPLVNIFGFSVHITHSCVNFIWFALLSHQAFNDRPLFKRGELFNFLLIQITPKQFFNNEIFFVTKQFQTMKNLHLRRKFWNKTDK